MPVVKPCQPSSSGLRPSSREIRTRNRGEEERASSHLVNQSGGADGHDQTEEGVADLKLGGRVREWVTIRDGRVGAASYTELGLLSGDTTTFVDEMGVVGNDGVTTVLGDDTDGDDDGEPPSVSLGLEEIEVAGAVGNLRLNAESLLDLAVLELDSQIVLVAVGVVLGQGLEGLVVAVLGDQPSGRLGDDCWQVVS